MKRSLLYCSLLTLCLAIVAMKPVFAQQEANLHSKSSNNIFEVLALSEDGLGTVIVHQPEVIRRQVARPSQKRSLLEDGEFTATIVQGFRIQVFNGNLPSSKQEAYHRAQIVNKNFPDITCYVSYKAPFWRLLVGDFRTHEEAQTALQEMKRLLPQVAGELYIVRDKIRALY
ncbi:SPOR domain-containing protein [Porphyromonas circumdentaria]|uniref:SPOR domain-containing protein n=1 Tax=Porphyromonas circumdentaria TaxID=29524 RepID=UPI0026DB8973|nr:SPOR domain-containing protein [Porphyromonas circumdentaria]MDO4722798.1 SPOR domain-containing protein [Porphyromonas circumdentaria]